VLKQKRGPIFANSQELTGASHRSPRTGRFPGPTGDLDVDPSPRSAPPNVKSWIRKLICIVYLLKYLNNKVTVAFNMCRPSLLTAFWIITIEAELSQQHHGPRAKQCTGAHTYTIGSFYKPIYKTCIKGKLLLRWLLNENENEDCITWRLLWRNLSRIFTCPQSILQELYVQQSCRNSITGPGQSSALVPIPTQSLIGIKV
jgi:hypothetical protein